MLLSMYQLGIDLKNIFLKKHFLSVYSVKYRSTSIYLEKKSRRSMRCWRGSRRGSPPSLCKMSRRYQSMSVKTMDDSRSTQPPRAFQITGEPDIDSQMPRFAMSRKTFHSDKTLIEKKCFGIPFKISDAEAIEAAAQHHLSGIDIHDFQRHMLPFWISQVGCGGSFSAEIFANEQHIMHNEFTQHWQKTPTYTFSFPYDEHFTFNQVSASYLYPSTVLENVCCGTHVPSMLISRFELLQELEDMKNPPVMTPFVMSAQTSLQSVSKRISRKKILHFCEKELRKHRGNFSHSRINILSLHVEARRVRPIYLPVYRLMVTSRFNSVPVPTFVCGATGKAGGATLTTSLSTKKKVGVVSSLAALGFGIAYTDPIVATTLAMGTAVGSTFGLNIWQRARFLRQQSSEMRVLKSEGLRNLQTDKEGYKWDVADEERIEFEYREELRFEARRKAEFQKRVEEEDERDRVRERMSPSFGRSRRTNVNPFLVDTDPLGYYKILGLSGRERIAEPKEISAAFRSEAQTHHPDLHSGDEDTANRQMQALLEAYNVLRDPKKKKEYDCGMMQKPKKKESKEDESEKS